MLISVIFNCVFVLIATSFAIKYTQREYHRRIKNIEMTLVFVLAWIDRVVQEENFCIKELPEVYEDFKKKGFFL